MEDGKELKGIHSCLLLLYFDTLPDMVLGMLVLARRNAAESWPGVFGEGERENLFGPSSGSVTYIQGSCLT